MVLAEGFRLDMCEVCEILASERFCKAYQPSHLATRKAGLIVKRGMDIGQEQLLRDSEILADNSGQPIEMLQRQLQK